MGWTIVLVLVGLLLLFGPVTGDHFAERRKERRRQDRYPWMEPVRHRGAGED